MIMLSRVRNVSLAFTVAILFYLSGCAAFSQGFETFNQAWTGVPATMTTWTQQGALVDQVKGTSFRVERDERFDTSSSSSDGGTTSKKDSQVLLVSLGDNTISHVGSTMILTEDGLAPVAGGQTSIRFENAEPGVPWLNSIAEDIRGLTQGKAKLIMIRSQDGTPIAVYAGNTVEPFATEVPKSTWFRVDGKMLLVYRADYTTVDIALLQ
jgi:hypothetical protein